MNHMFLPGNHDDFNYDELDDEVHHLMATIAYLIDNTFRDFEDAPNDPPTRMRIIETITERCRYLNLAGFVFEIDLRMDDTNNPSEALDLFGAVVDAIVIHEGTEYESTFVFGEDDVDDIEYGVIGRDQ